MTKIRPATMKELLNDRDAMEIDEVFKRGGFKKGEKIGDKAEVIAIFVHHESDCAWMYVASISGKLYHQEIDY